jgi:hypothetical protein
MKHADYLFAHTRGVHMSTQDGRDVYTTAGEQKALETLTKVSKTLAKGSR